VYDGERNAPLLIDLTTGRRHPLPSFVDADATHFLNGFSRLVAFAPDGRGFVRSDWDYAAQKHYARFFDGPSSSPTAWRMPGPPEYMTFSPDGRKAAAVLQGINEATGQRGYVICLIDPKTGEVVDTAKPLTFSSGPPAFSPDGRTLAMSQTRWPKWVNLSGSWAPANVQLSDVETLAPLALLKRESLVGWSANGRVVTASEGDLFVGPEIRVRDGRTGELISEHSLATPLGGVRGEWLPDTFRGSLVAATIKNDAPAWREWLAKHLPWRLFAVSWSSVLQVVDVEAVRVVATLPEPAENIAFSPDGLTAAVVDGKGLRIWDLPPRKPGGIVLGVMIVQMALFIVWTAWRRRSGSARPQSAALGR
jgi:WD40 repeat protein